MIRTISSMLKVVTILRSGSSHFWIMATNTFRRAFLYPLTISNSSLNTSLLMDSTLIKSESMPDCGCSEKPAPRTRQYLRLSTSDEMTAQMLVAIFEKLSSYGLESIEVSRW